jgi:hypothetical protein
MKHGKFRLVEEIKGFKGIQLRRFGVAVELERVLFIMARSHRS